MNFSFDSDTQEAANFELLKKGNYNVVLEEVELNDTKSGGARLDLKFTVCDAEFAGRKLYHTINVVNDSEKAVEIGKKDLAGLLLAAGKSFKFDGNILELDSALQETLADVPVVAKVYVEKDKNGEYEDKNRIRGFLSDKSNAPPKSSKGGWGSNKGGFKK